MKKIFTIQNIGEIAQEVVLHVIKSKQKNNATIIALSGDLGAGKTTLTQAIARELGVKENLQSPTFTILKRYALHITRYTSLVHIDAYRLKSGEELQKLNWEEYVSNPNNLIIIEWPENIIGLLSTDVISIILEHIGENERQITLK